MKKLLRLLIEVPQVGVSVLFTVIFITYCGCESLLKSSVEDAVWMWQRGKAYCPIHKRQEEILAISVEKINVNKKWYQFLSSYNEWVVRMTLKYHQDHPLEYFADTCGSRIEKMRYYQGPYE